MPFLTVSEFTERIRATPLPDVVRETLFAGEVFAFRDTPDVLDDLRTHLVEKLHLQRAEDVVVVGSAKMGYSVAPDTFARAFSRESDIDVVVVDAALFDECWMTLVQWNYLRPNRMEPAERQWARARSDDVYWGWLAPDKINFPGSLGTPHALRGLRDVTTRWFNAFRSLSLRRPELAARDINGRLYRTWGHAVEYHVSGLRQLRHRFSREP